MTWRATMSEREISRMSFRTALFQRRGLDIGVAEKLADRLLARDRDHDDRRACIECKHLQRSGGCFAAQQGWISGASRRLEPVTDILDRCPVFEFQTPS
jgi:hypothetical protein